MKTKKVETVVPEVLEVPEVEINLLKEVIMSLDKWQNKRLGTIEDGYMLDSVNTNYQERIVKEIWKKI